MSLLVAVALALLLLPGAARAQEIDWIRQFDTPFTDDAFDVATDATGVYVVGLVNGALPGETSTGFFDAFIRKYDPSGNELWTRQFGTGGFDAAHGVWVDSTGVYVTGEIASTLPGQTSAGESDAFLRKYDQNGNEIWTRQFGSPGSDSANAVSGDSTGLYVAGATTDSLPGQTSAGSLDAFLRKYDANGAELWTRQFGGPGVDNALGVAADATGVYAVGQDGAVVGRIEVLVRKFSLDGTDLWSRRFAGVGTARDIASGVATAAGGVYVAGRTLGTLPGQISAGNTDAFLRKYNVGGDELWTRQFGTSSFDAASGVVADLNGVYLSGSTQGTLGETNFGFQDVFARAYGADGSERWTTQLGSAFTDSGRGIALDTTAAYLVGSFGGDAFVAKLTLPIDTTPPTIACSASPSTLWPPNHKLRAVGVDISASDDSGSVTVALVSVTSSQPDSGLDPEDVPNDIQGWNAGADDRRGLLRSERFDHARVYTLMYRADDRAGNSATCEATVTVPKGQAQVRLDGGAR